MVHNPESNMNNAVGCADVLGMMKKGIRVGLGTDGMSSDMPAQMRCAYLLQRHQRRDPRVAFCEAPAMLLDNNAAIAAKIFGKKLGKLAVGAPADMVILDYIAADAAAGGQLPGPPAFRHGRRRARHGDLRRQGIAARQKTCRHRRRAPVRKIAPAGGQVLEKDGFGVSRETKAMCEYAFNDMCQAQPEWSGAEYAFLNDFDMLAFHRSLPGYEPTPLRQLPALAAHLGLAAVLVKDEAPRFGIKAFKALGASYAMYRFLKKKWHSRLQAPFTPESFQDAAALAELGSFTFCAATDGNHGRAVAWTAKKLGQKAVIYMPADSMPARVESIRGEGAEVVLVGGSFDDCVRRCAADAAANDWQAISDTAYPGYREIPAWILLGYTSIFAELEGLLHQRQTAGRGRRHPAGRGRGAGRGRRLLLLPASTGPNGRS